jgi:hypothetical protein
MVLAEQEAAEHSMRYDDDEQYHQHQYGDEDTESEEDLGFIQLESPHVLAVDDVLSCRIKSTALSKKCARVSGAILKLHSFPPVQV